MWILSLNKSETQLETVVFLETSTKALKIKNIHNQKSKQAKLH